MGYFLMMVCECVCECEILICPDCALFECTFDLQSAFRVRDVKVEEEWSAASVLGFYALRV